jgi:uncharacterized membrane protein (DUF106 family)
MESLNRIIDAVLLLFYRCFSWAPPVVGLTCLSIAAGAAMLWVFGKTSNQQRMKQVKRRVQAGLLELRVFVDEPVISLRAQRTLLAANLNYLFLALRPALWMIVPVGLLLVHLEAFYDRAPLPLSQPALVTMGMTADWDPSAPPPALTVPLGVEILGPPVRAVAAREVTWRIMPMSPVSADKLVFRFDGKQVSKWMEAGRRQRYVPGRRVRSGWGMILSPGEGRIQSDFAEWIEIGYPGAGLRVFGFRVNWLVWFFVVSMVAALFLKKRFGVVI